MKPLEECRLYTFVDTAYLEGRDPVEVARQLCEGGADLVQIRAKDLDPHEILRLAERILPVTRAAGVGLVINDHPDVARAVGAEFCHLGQEDFFDAGHRHVSELRPAGATFRVGLSTHAPEQALRAVAAGADYVAVGPVHPTGTKPGAPPVTLSYVRWAAENLRLPWFAIGGITLENVDEVLEAGARRICVVSAILKSARVSETCRWFRERLERFGRVP